MRTTLRILLPLALVAAAVLAADNYVEFFAKSPGLVLAGSLIVFVAYLPSLWVTRRLDRQPMRWAVYLAAIGFVVAFAPITSEVTWGVINHGVRYWQIVGLTEEAFRPGQPLFSAVMFFGALINTLLINALVIPILWKQIRRGPGRESSAVTA